MPAEIPTLTVVRGDRYVFDLTLWADAAQTTPYPIDDADEIKAELRTGTAAPVRATFQTTLQSPHIVRFVLPAEITATFEYDAAPLSWDLQVTWGTVPPLDVRTLVRGKLAVEGDITESDLAGLSRSARASTARSRVRA